MLDAAWLIPALPLLGFVILLLVGRTLGEPLAGWVATIMSFGSFVVAVVVYAGLVEREAEARSFTQVLFSWIAVGSLDIRAALLVDPLSITMVLFITGVGSLIHLYAIGYMHGDENYAKFFVYLNLFLFSMLMLVLGDNLIVTFLGWEGVGASSYLLISFWFTRESAAVAGKKAFITNRIGDHSYLVGMFVVFALLGSLNYTDIAAKAPNLTGTQATVIVLLFMVAASAKSAQFPLSVWLPDAMEGPTPVSAMVHAATMVTAGVYLMIRLSPVLALSPGAMDWIAIVGAFTAFTAAAAAAAQYDIKKVLAYSTISQLGYMFLAIGSGAYVAAIFHVVAHAFFKALLFLGAGSVIHGMDDEQDMRRMGGLRGAMPITAATFMVGWVSIIGAPPFVGFWSKDEVLLAAWGDSQLLWFVGILTALLTAYYMSRLVFMTFFGKSRWDQPIVDNDGELVSEAPAEEIHPHESPATMWVPLVVLAGLSIAGGIMNMPIFGRTLYLEHWLEPVVGEHVSSASTETKVALASTATMAALVGLVIAAYFFLLAKRSVKALEPKLLQRAWGFDDMVGRFMGGPGRKSFELTTQFDSAVVDGTVNAVGQQTRNVGTRLRVVQTGFVRNYAVAVALGGLALVIWFISRAGF